MAMALQTDARASGAEFGPYRVMRELGRGGMGRVYEAEHVRLGKRVAIKTIHVSTSDTEDKRRRRVARLFREGRSAARVRHAHVVEVFDMGERDGTPYLVMELVHGGTLAARLEHGPLPIDELIGLMVPICAAVAHAHRADIIHRDLKPENILLATEIDGRVTPKVADFGVCRSLLETAQTELTRDGSLVGTLSYMAPEQVRAPKLVSAASDQYSLGVLLYRAATGKLPFDESDPVALMQHIASEQPAPPSFIDSTLPEWFDALVLRALATDPDRRFRSVRELGAALLERGSDTLRDRWTKELVDGPAAPLLGVQSQGLPAEEPRALTYTSSHDSLLGQEAPFRKPTARAGRFLWGFLAGVALTAALTLGVALGEVRHAPPRGTALSSASERPPALNLDLEVQPVFRSGLGADVKNPPVNVATNNEVNEELVSVGTRPARASRRGQRLRNEASRETREAASMGAPHLRSAPEMGLNGAPILD